MSPPSYPSDTDFRLVHVSHKTRVSKCVSVSLSLLEEADPRPLCLHTLPPPGTPVEEIERTITTSKTNPDKNGVGRLISIAEIIKRHFASSSAAEHRPSKRRKTDGPDRASSRPLHQYNEYGSLEALLLERPKTLALSPEHLRAALAARQANIVHEFLDEERTRPRQSHTPWLKIYLGHTEIAGFQNRANVSYQRPLGPQESPAPEDPSLARHTLPAAALPPTLVNPHEDLLEEAPDLAPI